MHTSLSLLQRLREEQPTGRSWQQLEAYCRPLILRRVRGHLNDHDADDLAQEVMQVVCQKIISFERQREGSFRAFLYEIIRLQLLAFQRKAERAFTRGTVDVLLAELSDSNGSQSERWDAEHRQHLLEQALKNLEAEFQPTSIQVFRLMVLEEVPGPEAARQVGLTPVAAHGAKARILKRLREEISDFLD